MNTSSNGFLAFFLVFGLVVNNHVERDSLLLGVKGLEADLVVFCFG